MTKPSDVYADWIGARLMEPALLLGNLSNSSRQIARQTLRSLGFPAEVTAFLLDLAADLKRFENPHRMVARLGWEKARMIAPHLEKSNYHPLCARAERYTGAQLRDSLAGDQPSEGKVPLLLEFTEEEYEEVFEKLRTPGVEYREKRLDAPERAILELLRGGRET